MIIPYLKWITYAVMPLVYDESLSYVELLNKVVAKLNEVIGQTNNLSQHIDSVLSEWLKTDEAQTAIQETVGKYIDEYAKTSEFNAVLVAALSSQSEEISEAATTATENWLNSEAGDRAIADYVAEYMEAYIKTDAFSTLVANFVAELDDIKRGSALDIRQKASAAIAAPMVEITGCPIAGDYSKSPGYMLKVSEGGITVNNGNDALLEVTDEIALHEALNLNESRIINVAAPLVGKDAANKDYVDSKISGDGAAGIKYISLTYSAADNRYHSRETFTEVMSAYPNVAAIFSSGDRNVFFPISTDGATIVFGVVTITEGNNVKLSSAKRVSLNSDNIWEYIEVNDSNANYVRTNGSVPFTASQSMGGNRLVSLGAPVNDNDAATLKTVRNAAGVVLRGTAVFNADGTITEVDGVDYSSIAAAALANTNIMLLLSASNIEETYLAMRFVGKRQLATSGSNRYRYTFIGAAHNADIAAPVTQGNVYGLDFNEGDDPLQPKDAYFIVRGISSVVDFAVRGSTSQDGALEAITIAVPNYPKTAFDTLIEAGANVRLVVEADSAAETRYCYMSYKAGGNTHFSSVYRTDDQTVNTQLFYYDGSEFHF